MRHAADTKLDRIYYTLWLLRQLQLSMYTRTSVMSTDLALIDVLKVQDQLYNKFQ